MFDAEFSDIVGFITLLSQISHSELGLLLKGFQLPLLLSEFAAIWTSPYAFNNKLRGHSSLSPVYFFRAVGLSVCAFIYEEEAVSTFPGFLEKLRRESFLRLPLIFFNDRWPFLALL